MLQSDAWESETVLIKRLIESLVHEAFALEVCRVGGASAISPLAANHLESQSASSFVSAFISSCR